MLVSVREVATFLAHHEPVVSLLWEHRSETWTNGDLLGLVSKSGDPAGASYLIAELKKLRFLVERMEPVGSWELAPPFQRWVEFLQMTSRPVRSEVIHGYILSLEASANEFSRCWPQPEHWSAAREALEEIWRQLRKITDDLQATQLAIINEVADAKSERSRLSATERFRRINRIWELFLMPMLDLLDLEQKFWTVCVSIERELERALAEQALPERRVAARITDEIRTLQHTVREGFLASRKEIEPLHTRLRKESEWTQGAAHLLQRLGRERDFPIQLGERLKFSVFRLRQPLTTLALKRYAAEWQNFQAEPGVPIDFNSPTAPTNKKEALTILNRCTNLPTDRFPIADLAAFMAQEFPDADFYTLLRAVSLVFKEKRLQSSFHFPRSDYRMGGGTVRLARISIQKVSKSK